jgi:hypothetical protein
MAMENSGSEKGAVIRIFGVVLIFLGILDSMLSWRGGFAVSTVYVFLIAAGIFLYGIGSIRRRQRT